MAESPVKGGTTSDPFVAASCKEIWVKIVTARSFGSGCRFLYPSMMNAVTVAEKRPAYDVWYVSESELRGTGTHENERSCHVTLPSFNHLLVFSLSFFEIN